MGLILKTSFIRCKIEFFRQIDQFSPDFFFWNSSQGGPSMTILSLFGSKFDSILIKKTVRDVISAKSLSNEVSGVESSTLSSTVQKSSVRRNTIAKAQPPKQICFIFFLHSKSRVQLLKNDAYKHTVIWFMCTTKLNIVYNGPYIWITNNLIHHMELFNQW